MLYRGTKVALAEGVPLFRGQFRQPHHFFSKRHRSTFRTDDFGLIFGILVTAMGAAGFAGSLAAAARADRGGYYDSAFLIGLAAILLGLLPGVLLQRFSVTLSGPGTGKGEVRAGVFTLLQKGAKRPPNCFQELNRNGRPGLCPGSREWG
ncbi:MAG: hypothetical protein GYA86_09380 [Firmicutes bacterium]|nr:hypothetical protein [Bacillota bacterium]